MDLKSLQTEMSRLQTLVAAWKEAEDITPIERDLALARLRDLYEAIRFGIDPMPTTVAEEMPEMPAEEEAVAEEEPVALDAAAFIALDTLLDEPIAEEQPLAEEQPTAEEQPLVEEQPTEEAPAEEEEEITPIEEAEEPAEIEVEEQPVAEEPAPEPIEEQPTVVTEPLPESAPAPEPEQPAKPAVQNLFGEAEEATVRHRHKQRVIMSLYDAAPEPMKRREPEIRIETLLPPESEVIVVEAEPEVIEISEEELLNPVKPHTVSVAEQPTEQPTEQSVEQPVEQPAEEPTIQPTLGESIPAVQTLADKLAAEHEVVTEVRREPITDLRRAVGINDKFLLIHELFNGNGSLYEITIRRLNEFDNLDDCMIYIAENFAWNPNSDGAKLMMDLLERKFLS